MTVYAPQFGASGSDETALFLKLYSGSYVEAPRSSIFLYDKDLPFIRSETVSFGKSFQFLMDADIPEPEDFVPGDEIMGQKYAVEEGTVTIDGYLVAHKHVRRDEMQMSHFNILPRLARQHKARIGRAYDRRFMTLAARAARAAAVTKSGLTVHSGGNRVTRSGGSSTYDTAVSAAYPLSASGAANFRADLRQLGKQMDDDNIDPNNRWIVITPYIRQVLLFDNTAQVFSKDYLNGVGNDINKREIVLIEGFRLLGIANPSSNNGPLPTENFVTGLSKYQGNFTPQASNGGPVCLAFAGSMEDHYAIGVAKYESVQNVVVYRPEKMVWLVMSFLLIGADYMHPWCCGSIEVTS